MEFVKKIVLILGKCPFYLSVYREILGEYAKKRELYI